MRSSAAGSDDRPQRRKEATAQAALKAISTCLGLNNPLSLILTPPQHEILPIPYRIPHNMSMGVFNIKGELGGVTSGEGDYREL